MLREQHPRDRRTGISIPRTLWLARTSWCFLPARPYQVRPLPPSLCLLPLLLRVWARVCVRLRSPSGALASRAPTKYKTFYLRLSRGLTWSPNGKHRHKDKLYNCSLKREKRQISENILIQEPWWCTHPYLWNFNLFKRIKLIKFRWMIKFE